MLESSEVFLNKIEHISLFILLIVVVFLFPSKISFASPATLGEAQSMMEQGNKFYQDKQYEQALDAYHEVINLGYEGTSLYYNLGNSYYREGKIGLAILYYEKALKLSPGDDNATHNLAIANAKTVDKIDTLPKFFLFQWWENLLAFFSTGGWSRAVYIFYLLLLVSIGLYFFVRRSSLLRYSVYFGLISSALLIITATIWIVKLNRDWNVKNAIVINAAVPVKLAPDSTSNDAFVIHEGLKVKELDQVGKWIDIRLQDGKEGWVPKDELGTI